MGNLLMTRVAARLRLGMIGVLGGVVMTWLAGAEPPGTVTTGRGLFALVVSHQQGWGQVGLDTAAHAPGTTPLGLRIGSRTYARGLGTHAPAVTVLALDGAYRMFEADAGVQWQGGTGTGSVVMTVLVDGKKVFESGVLREGDEPVPVRVSTRGARELRLEVSDAGDGITCDVANWATPRLEPDPDATKEAEGPTVDIAPFARLLAWDPARTEGCQATRLETMSEEELYPEQPVTPGEDGRITVPVFGDGRPCVGLEWMERRRLGRLELVFAEGMPSPAGISVEYWHMPEAGSRWQGNWRALPGQGTTDGMTWRFLPDWTTIPDGVPYGTSKVRFILPASPGPTRLERIRAFSRCRYAETVLWIMAEPGDTRAPWTVELYNGALAGTAELSRTWTPGEPLELKVIHAVPASWQQVEQTVLRFHLPDDAFGVAVNDVTRNGYVFVPHAGLLVADASHRDMTPARAREQVNTGKTILDRVRAMPEQTREQAMARTHLPGLDGGPTMLSLAADNRKFVVTRTGDVSFEDDPAMYNEVSKVARDHPCRMKVILEGEDPLFTRRALEKAWYPVLRIDRGGPGVQVENRVYVAPYSPPRTDRPFWWRDRVMGVSAFFLNPETGREARLTLDFSGSMGPVSLDWDAQGRHVLARHGERLVAAVVPETGNLALAIDNALLRVTAANAARLVVFFPAWEGAVPGDIPGLDAVDALARTTLEYWDGVMSSGARFDLPDDLLNRVVPASIVHCWMAARNDGGRTVAPWIASMAYGPLESEAHSVIRGMARMGQDDFARRGFEYFIERYNDKGYLTTGYTVLGTGWHLWTLGEYVALSDDRAWLSTRADAVNRVCRWVMAERRKTMRTDNAGNRVPEYGLMPPGVLADWNVFAYYFYLNGNYCAGLREAGGALATIGYPGADEIVADAEAFRQDILRAYDIARGRAPVVRLENGAWVPYYPCQLLAPLPVGALYDGEDVGRSWCYDVELGSHHLVPMGVLAPEDPRAGWIIQHMEDVQFLRPGWFQFTDEEANRADWFNLGGFAKVQPYYARTVEFHALRDDEKPFLRSFFNALASLLNTEDLSIWEHFIAGAYNKTHETGYFLGQVRLVLAQERGRELWLAPFTPAEWLTSGQRVVVEDLPTLFGPMGYTLESRLDMGYVDAVVTPPCRNAPDAIVLRLRHPENARIRGVEADGAITAILTDDGRSIRLVPKPGRDSVRLRARFEP